MIWSRNIKFCAYLRLKGIHPETINKISKGKAEYGFKIAEKEWDQLQVIFNKSECMLFAQALDAIKDMAY